MAWPKTQLLFQSGTTSVSRLIKMSSAFFVNTTHFPPVISTSSSLVTPHPEQETSHGSKTFGYILVPVAAIAVILMVSGLVLMLWRRKRHDRLRLHLMPLYTFDASDDQEEWEAELLDDVSEGSSLRRGYKSMEFSLSLNRKDFP